MNGVWARLEARWIDYWFRPEPLLNLAALRVAAVTTKLLRWPDLEALRAKAELPLSLYDPPHFLWLVSLPLGGGPPPIEIIAAVWWAALAGAALALVGLFTRVGLLVLSLGLLVLGCFDYAWSEFHHTEELLHLALLLLALSPSGEVLSLDALRRGGWSAATSLRESAFARWPRLVVAWVLSLAYLSAGTSKLLYGSGAEWLNGYTLQYYLLQDGLRWDRPLGVWLAESHLLAVLCSWATVLFECLFCLVLLVPSLWVVLVPAGIVFHLTIYVLQAAPFFSFYPLYVALVPVGALVLRARGRFGLPGLPIR